MKSIFLVQLILLGLVCSKSIEKRNDKNGYALLWPDDNVTYATTKPTTITNSITTVRPNVLTSGTNLTTQSTSTITSEKQSTTTIKRSQLINIICNSCNNLVINNHFV